jgi:hypothetical protein
VLRSLDAIIARWQSLGFCCRNLASSSSLAAVRDITLNLKPIRAADGEYRATSALLTSLKTTLTTQSRRHGTVRSRSAVQRCSYSAREDFQRRSHSGQSTVMLELVRTKRPGDICIPGATVALHTAPQVHVKVAAKISPFASFADPSSGL